MIIHPLADHPEAIPRLAKWFYDEWHGLEGRSIQDIEKQLGDNLNRDSIPITFVAYQDHQLAGSVSLDLSDLPPFDHLSPWLASLYVIPAARSQGVASALVGHLMSFAASRGIDPLYLWTPGSTGLYERFGWTVFASTNYSSQSIAVMRFQKGMAKL